jgi:hypothetical protein
LLHITLFSVTCELDAKVTDFKTTGGKKGGGGGGSGSRSKTTTTKPDGIIPLIW